MGIYDREYYQVEERSSFWAGRPVVINLILINVGLYVANLLFGKRLFDNVMGTNTWLELDADWYKRPWQFYQLLTYGFAHDPGSVLHILFNMYSLWLFGREVENIYGRAEFTRLYLALIVLAGAVWCLVDNVTSGGNGELMGASGAVVGVMMIFVMHYPRQIFYFFGVLPIPAWGLAALLLVGDLMGALSRDETDNVAYVAHLAGAAFGYLYYRTGMNLGRMLPRKLSLRGFRPRLRLHDPDNPRRDLSREVDAILEKISQQGEASLTKRERRTLEEASRRYQRRRG